MIINIFIRIIIGIIVGIITGLTITVSVIIRSSIVTVQQHALYSADKSPCSFVLHTTFQMFDRVG